MKLIKKVISKKKRIVLNMFEQYYSKKFKSMVRI